MKYTDTCIVCGKKFENFNDPTAYRPWCSVGCQYSNTDYEEEKQMTTVYVVTEGDYSDYRIIGVFSSEDKANRFKDLNGNRYANIEHWDLDQDLDIPEGYYGWYVKMDREGNTTEFGIGKAHPNCLYDWQPTGQKGWTSYGVIARDEKHAVKIANERRAALIASGIYTENYLEWKKLNIPRLKS